MEDRGLGCEGAGGENDIMGTVNKRMAELAYNSSQNFRWRFSLVQEDIELSIIEPLTSEVVMTRMIEVSGAELVLGAEMGKER